MLTVEGQCMTQGAPVKPRGKKVQRWTEEQSRFWFGLGKTLVGLVFKYWIRCFSVTGTEHVPAYGGVFLVANHTSALDPLIFGLCLPYRSPRGPGKALLFENPFFAFILRKIGIFPLRIDGADAAGVRTMVDLYRHGKVVIVFPEGGRSRSGELQPFTPDFTRLVIRLRAPILPAGIAGAGETLPMDDWIPRYHSAISVAFGPCFDLSEFYGRDLTPEALAQATEILQQCIASLVAQARSEREVLMGRC